MTRAKQCTRSVPTLTYMSTSYVHSPTPPVTLSSLRLAACSPCSPLSSLSLSSSLPLFQHPLQRCTFQPIAYRVRLQCARVHLPHSTRTTPRRRTTAPPFDPSLPRVLFLFLELPASVGAIDALHRVTKLEAKRKALKYPPELLNVSSYVSRVLVSFFSPPSSGVRTW